MVAGYIKELFSSFQGEGPYAGRRQVFIRFAGCPLSCIYCDTAYARYPEPAYCTVLNKGSVSRIKNPMEHYSVIHLVSELLTPDTHSICYTGGEPLFNAVFVDEIAKEARRLHYRNFIETSGYSARAFESIARDFDIASIDIKLRSHRAVRDDDYESLYDNELDCIRISVDRGLETIVKVVVMRGTPVSDIEVISRALADLRIKFVLQPVTDNKPDIDELFTLSEVAGSFIDDVMVIPQVHRCMGVL